jgi:uncharacterized membrane protein
MSWGIAFRLRQQLKGSLYALPVLGALLGPVLGQLTISFDRSVQLPEAWSYSAATATAVLSVLVGAMVALLGFVVTIGVLVVQMATGTLSPRYMRLWYRDLLQKVVLATLAGTLTFSFSLLSHVEETSVPDVGVTLSGVLVSASLILLLVYLNRFTHSLRPVAVAATVADAGRQVFQGAPALEAAALGAGGDGGPGERPAGPATVVRTARAGAIQAIDVRGLMALAREHDSVLILPHSVGDFVPTGASLVQVYGPAPSTVLRRVRRMFALGRERTIEQDPAFALRILVDIAIRALSPAVNDPTTAVQVLNYIEDLLLVIGRGKAHGHGELRDPDGRLRLVVPLRHFEQYLDLGVTEIRQYGAHSVQVTRRLRALLEELRSGVLPERRAAVDAELCRLEASVAASFADSDDRSLAGESDRQGIGGPARPRPG